MKHLILSLTLMLFAVAGLSGQTKDTLTVSQNTKLGTITIKSQKSGSLSVNPFEYNGYGNIQAVYATANTDTMVYLQNVKTSAIVARYRKTQFYFAFHQLGITQATANWLNAAYFNPPNLQQLNLTSAVRDSLSAWGTVAPGTIILNTTIDSPQIYIDNTINWRSF